MSIERTAAAETSAAAVTAPGPVAAVPRLRLVPDHEHDWRLRDVEYVDGFAVQRFECDACGEVDFF